MNHPFSGVYAAALTPLKKDFAIDRDGLTELLNFLARRGCHGAVLLGTTGEGPSFSPNERLTILQAAREVLQEHPEFRLLAGTGTPSLDETIELTKVAFDLGYQGVLVLPPYYFRKASEDGLYAWFRELIQRAVPSGGGLLGYHIPPVSGVPLPLDLLSRLKESFPERFIGIKDSSTDPEFARALGDRFGKDLIILNGTDRLLSLALENNASGSITALANIISPDLRRVWDANQRGEKDPVGQAKLNDARDVSDRFSPAPPLLKVLLSRFHDFPKWAVKPPLLPLSQELEERAVLAWRTRGKIV